MTKSDKRLMKEWVKERDEVAKTYDVEKFKLFFRKWQIKGIYDKQMKLPSDNVIAISLRKMVYHMTSATEEEKKEAEAWLLDHGSSTSI